MPDNGSGPDSYEEFLDGYRLTGEEPFYRTTSDRMATPHFDLIDDYLSAMDSRIQVELAEEGFINYHRNGKLTETDRITAYAAGQGLEQQRVKLNDLTQIVLGKKHEITGDKAAVPVKFTDIEYPYQNFDLFMPTHSAVEQELRRMREQKDF